MRTRVLGLLLGSLAGGLLSAGCGTRQQPKVPTNLVLITLDTTRADRLGSYGHAAAKTETLMPSQTVACALLAPIRRLP